MNDAQAQGLRHAEDQDFAKLATGLGFECAGPSERGAFLIREQNGKTWLFSAQGHSQFGRTIVPSVWTDLNASVMNQTYRMAAL